MTGQSNISNAKNSMDVLKYARSLGYHTLLDAAALAPTSKVSLADIEVDAMAISFYKMFGFPTGVGALVVRKDFLKTLQRPWFSGGTVEIVQVPGNIVTRSRHLHEQFEVNALLTYLDHQLTLVGLGWNDQLSCTTGRNRRSSISLRLHAFSSPSIIRPFRVPCVFDIEHAT